MSSSASKPGFFTFEGRIRRRTYWGKVLYLWLILFATAMLTAALFPAFQKSGNGGFVLGAAFIVALVCCIAMWPVNVRRLHDRNMSGWWLLWFFLLSFIPFVGWFVPIVQFVILGCLCGTPGPNHYGPDPKAKPSEEN